MTSQTVISPETSAIHRMVADDDNDDYDSLICACENSHTKFQKSGWPRTHRNHLPYEIGTLPTVFNSFCVQWILLSTLTSLCRFLRITVLETERKAMVQTLNLPRPQFIANSFLLFSCSFVLPCVIVWPETYYIDQAELKLERILPPFPKVLVLWV